MTELACHEIDTIDELPPTDREPRVTQNVEDRVSVGPGRMIGSYRVLSLLGQGGAASVYLGEHPVIGTKVAIKVIAPHLAAIPDLARRFVQEARSSSELSNPHIPRYFDFGVLETGQPYAVMEYFAGETLWTRLEREGALPLHVTVDILSQVAGAMVQVHAAQLVHRDLKPDNLYLTTSATGRLEVKILDFGIAKALTTTASPTDTSPGIVLGTPVYCAPEQAMGRSVGPSADVYALGATAYEMLTGRLPFDGTIAAIFHQKTTGDAPMIDDPSVPAHVAASIARMLAREPEHRVATMTDVLAELATWDEPLWATTPRSSVKPKRALWKPLAGLSVAAAAASVAFALVGGRRDTAVTEASPDLVITTPAVTGPASAPAPAPAQPAPVASPLPAPPPATPPSDPPPSPRSRHVVAPPAPAVSKPAPAKRTHAADPVIVDPFND